MAGAKDGGDEGPAEETFEVLLSRLEDVVGRLESGELPLEDALALFEEGVRLSRLGAQRLDAAERRVEELLASDPLRTRPILDDAHGEERP